MASVLTDIATFLAASGLGVFDPVGVASTIFTHALPDAPPSALSVELYGAAPTGPYAFDAPLPVHEGPRVQVTARDPDGDAALAACDAAYRALIALSDVALGGVHYFAVRAVSGPLGLGRDENNLFRYVVSVQATRALS